MDKKTTFLRIYGNDSTVPPTYVTPSREEVYQAMLKLDPRGIGWKEDAKAALKEVCDKTVPGRVQLDQIPDEVAQGIAKMFQEEYDKRKNN